MIEGFHHHKAPEESRLLRPTDHQLGLLKGYALGLCLREMAEKRGIAYGTVKNALHELHGRLHTYSSLQSLVRCLDLGLLSLEELAEGYDLSGIETLSPLQRDVLHEIAFSGEGCKIVARSLERTRYSVDNNLSYVRNKLQTANPGRRITTPTAVIIYRAYLCAHPQRAEIPA